MESDAGCHDIKPASSIVILNRQTSHPSRCPMYEAQNIVSHSFFDVKEKHLRLKAIIFMLLHTYSLHIHSLHTILEI